MAGAAGHEKARPLWGAGLHHVAGWAILWGAPLRSPYVRTAANVRTYTKTAALYIHPNYISNITSCVCLVYVSHNCGYFWNRCTVFF